MEGNFTPKVRSQILAQVRRAGHSALIAQQLMRRILADDEALDKSGDLIDSPSEEKLYADIVESRDKLVALME